MNLHRVAGPAEGSFVGGMGNRIGRLVVVLLTVLLAFGLRAGSLTAQSLWRDEVDALCYAFEFPYLVARVLDPVAAGDLSTPCACPPPPVVSVQGQLQGLSLHRLARVMGPMIRQNGPLYFFLLQGWVAMTGHSVYALRFLSLWFGVLSVPLTYVLGRRLLGRTAGALAAALAAASPYLVWYGQEVKMYSLISALALLAIYSLRRAVDGGGKRWWVGQVIVTSLAFYTHVWSALLVPVQVVLLLSWWPRWRRRWPEALVSLALLTLPYLPLAFWQVPAALRVRETGFPHHSLGEMALILLNGW
ncbi:MAG TPA: phospholipid carrier-dependent glycosyltransferase, partial [Anaerolineae bacterium]|nr:phospholipid carrier-dependent glycosyltransferase [Anaerolineae bacterium]